ncbi:5'-deoxyadenosylcobinamide phosphate nucleotidyltransferase [Methanotorris formicicus Mc-S-70]|uniref:5'-deoxyadenosylcobinamide phosphate nucleotidyltransferase n=2 Tax=Methanotorris formicicus TaxID=213185 RepID=H1KY49_9EURY|nr:5'-deoxyadenosylcobinamide phosphate nucleotidyltransferase [Methanotorris formicicus Mc-S-70]
MAGGKGTRMGYVEKPLVEINGKFMIDYIIETLTQSNIEKIFVAVSKNTPKTEQYLKEKYRDIVLIKTSGNGYVEDLNEAIKYFSSPFLVVSSDIPTIKPKTINNIINYYLNIRGINNKVEALCVMVKKDNYLGNPTMELDGYIPAGINIISPKYGEQIEEVMVVDEVLINVNTWEDKILAEKLLKQLSKYREICP